MTVFLLTFKSILKWQRMKIFFIIWIKFEDKLGFINKKEHIGNLNLFAQVTSKKLKD